MPINFRLQKRRDHGHRETEDKSNNRLMVAEPSPANWAIPTFPIFDEKRSHIGQICGQHQVYEVKDVGHRQWVAEQTVISYRLALEGDSTCAIIDECQRTGWFLTVTYWLQRLRAGAGPRGSCYDESWRAPRLR